MAPRLKGERDGFVYFIRALDGPVKIGFAYVPERRVRDLQTSSPVPLRLVRCVAGELEDEAALHKKCDEWRLHGEWFSPTAPVLDVVGSPLQWRIHDLWHDGCTPKAIPEAAGITLAEFRAERWTMKREGWYLPRKLHLSEVISRSPMAYRAA